MINDEIILQHKSLTFKKMEMEISVAFKIGKKPGGAIASASTLHKVVEKALSMEESISNDSRPGVMNDLREVEKAGIRFSWDPERMDTFLHPTEEGTDEGEQGEIGRESPDEDNTAKF